jgi:hypothetical protein
VNILDVIILFAGGISLTVTLLVIKKPGMEYAIFKTFSVVFFAISIGFGILIDLYFPIEKYVVYIVLVILGISATWLFIPKPFFDKYIKCLIRK